MKLSDDYKKTAFCHLAHPRKGPLYEGGDKEKPVGIHHYSSDSKEYRAAVARHSEQMKEATDKGENRIDAMNDFNRRVVASVCTRADFIEDDDGNPISGEDSFYELFSDEGNSAYFEQVQQSIQDRKNFF